MVSLRHIALAVALPAAALSATAASSCPVTNGRINVLANDFIALRGVTEFAEKCVGEGATFGANHTLQHREIQVAALTANPSEYTAAIVANSAVVPLLNDGLVRPLDDLVAKHGQDLLPNQFIRVDGKIMAIAFMANAQHLIVRQDILDQVGKPIPTTYEEVLETAEAIRAAGIMQYPFAMLSRSDWNLGAEFVNMYLGHGGEFFEPGTPVVSVNNGTGIATVNVMKSLLEYSNPDFLTYDTEVVSPLWEAGSLAMAAVWGSTIGGLTDEEGAVPGVAENTVATNAMYVGGGDTPASTLWWDGFTIATNISDEDAEATFIALVNGLSDEMVQKYNDHAVWLMNAYVPSKAADGVALVAASGAEPYPMLPYMDLLHTAFFQELPDFLQGSESAEQTLSDIEAAYTAAAREQGYLQ